MLNGVFIDSHKSQFMSGRLSSTSSRTLSQSQLIGALTRCLSQCWYDLHGLLYGQPICEMVFHEGGYVFIEMCRMNCVMTFTRESVLSECAMYDV